MFSIEFDFILKLWRNRRNNNIELDDLDVLEKKETRKRTTKIYMDAERNRN